jgi:pimeloyl-ACP methyl ester carboxylesterase
VVFVDAIVVKIRDGQVTNRPVYVAIGVTVNGERDILGLWAGDGSEGAKFWLSMLTEIKNRGVEDVCILVCDGLKGLPDSVTTGHPAAHAAEVSAAELTPGTAPTSRDPPVSDLWPGLVPVSLVTVGEASGLPSDLDGGSTVRGRPVRPPPCRLWSKGRPVPGGASVSALAVRRRLTPIITLLVGLASVLGLVAAAPIAVAQPAARSAPSSTADAAGAANARTGGMSHGAKPTVVLVHGAWADSSSWTGVIERLQRAGYPVRAVYNPLRGLANDSAVLAGFLSTIPGPVVLVAHSYGGAVISNGAAASPNVKALVYVDAFVPDVGESVLQLLGPDSVLAGNPATVFDVVPFGPGPADLDLYLKKNIYQDEFASDLPRRTSAVLYATQRPASAAGFAETATAAAWKTIPSWYLVGTRDAVIPPDRQRFMAQRAGARTVEITSSHVSLISHPAAVTALIVAAARTVH